MDTLTHALSGALIARATADRGGAASLPLARRVALGALAAAFPDADIVMALGSPIDYLLNHRGATHSLVMLPLWAWLLAWIAARLVRDPRGAQPYLAACAMGIGIHIAGDVITSYGTMILAPLSDARFALGTTFVIDLAFSGIILAGLAGSWLWRASRVPALAACALLAGYVGMQAMLRGEALEAGRAYARAQGLEGATVSAIERPVSPFNWTIVVAKGEDQRYADVNLLRSRMPAPAAEDAGLIARISSSFVPVSMARWQRAERFGASPEDRRLAREAWEQPAFSFFRWFADYPALYRIDRGNPSDCVWFQDLRFALSGRGSVPFRYGMCREAGGPWRPFQLRDDGTRLMLR